MLNKNYILVSYFVVLFFWILLKEYLQATKERFFEYKFLRYFFFVGIYLLSNKNNLGIHIYIIHFFFVFSPFCFSCGDVRLSWNIFWNCARGPFKNTQFNHRTLIRMKVQGIGMVNEGNIFSQRNQMHVEGWKSTW